MQGKKLFSFVTGFLFLGLSIPAVAAVSAPYGWYLEGNVGSTRSTNTNYNGTMRTAGIGYNVNIGYKFMPYIATEMGYTLYSDGTIKNAAGNKAANVRNYSYDLALRGILPVAASGFELFAKIGVERVNAKVGVSDSTVANAIGVANSNNNATGLYYGVGAQYYVMPELAFNVQWARASGDTKTGNLSLLSGGFSFIFD